MVENSRKRGTRNVTTSFLVFIINKIVVANNKSLHFCHFYRIFFNKFISCTDDEVKKIVPLCFHY